MFSYLCTSYGMQKTWFKKVTLGACVHKYLHIIHTYTNPPCLYKVLWEDAEPELLRVQGNHHPVLDWHKHIENPKNPQNVDGFLEKKCQKFHHLWRFLDFWRHSHLRRCVFLVVCFFLMEGNEKNAVKSRVFVAFFFYHSSSQCSLKNGEHLDFFWGPSLYKR